jgi:hypothetical protein
MKIRALLTVSAIVETIGRGRLMAITGKRTQNVTNWVTAGYFPPETFVVITSELAALGYRAPPSLWRMIPAKRRAA